MAGIFTYRITRKRYECDVGLPWVYHFQHRNVALNSEGRSQGESPMDEGKMMSAEECAEHILHAIEKRKRTLVLTFTGKRTVFMNRFFPSLC
jgi:short-subunit dehydrogenase